MSDTSLTDKLAEQLYQAAAHDAHRETLTKWVEEHREALGAPEYMRILPAIYAAALATTNDDDFGTQGTPYYLRDHDLKEWAAVVQGEDLPELEGFSRFRWHQFGSADLTRVGEIDLEPEAIAEKLGLPSIRGQWDQWLFEDFLFQVSGLGKCVLSRKMEDRILGMEGFILEVDDRRESELTEAVLTKLDLTAADLS